MSKFIKKFISTLVLFFLIHTPLQAGDNVSPAKVALGQFHQDKGHVVWMFQNQNFSTPGGYWICIDH
jgi:hypothetical protein